MKYTATINIASKLKIALKIPKAKKFDLLPGAECRNCCGGVDGYYRSVEYNKFSFYRQLEAANIGLIREVIAEIAGTSLVVIKDNYKVSHEGNGWYEVTELPRGWDTEPKLPVVTCSTTGHSWAGGDRTNVHRQKNAGVLNIPVGGGEIRYTPETETELEPMVIGEKSLMGGWV